MQDLLVTCDNLIKIYKVDSHDAAIAAVADHTLAIRDGRTGTETVRRNQLLSATERTGIVIGSPGETHQESIFIDRVGIMQRWEQQFLFQGKQLQYNRIPFNNRAERAVEIPIAIDFLARTRRSNGRLLEIGNVLQRYEESLGGLSYQPSRRIIDKFEQGEGVENHDLMDLDSPEKYQAIISISTIEHIGQQCTPTGEFGEVHGRIDQEAPLKAIAKLYDLLDIDGHALVTVPFGKLIAGGWYIQFSAQYMDLLVTRYGIPQEALEISYLKQVAREKKWANPRQCWIEATADELREASYDTFWSGARAIAVLELTKLPHPFTLNLALPPAPLVYEHSSCISHLLMLFGRLRRSIC